MPCADGLKAPLIEQSLMGQDFEQLRLEVRDLRLAIGEKEILKGVTCSFQPGQLTALVGPSGAGKTTLLNCMAGFARGAITGSVSVNGLPPPDDYKLKLNFVPQEDILYPAPTVYSTLLTAARLRLPGKLPYKQKVERVNEVIQQLSLTDCQHTRVGNHENRGISGGQRKRLSIGLELLTNPSLLFLDEPTSGLDSKTAEDAIMLLKQLALQGRTVVATIHQPSHKLFMQFDQVVMVSKGELVYTGAPGDELRDYFFSAGGWESSANENPADFYMRTLQEPGVHETLVKIAAQGNGGSTISSTLMYTSSSPSCCGKRYPTSFCQQMWVLAQRKAYESIFNKSKMVQGLLLKAIVSVMCGLCFLNQARPTTSESIFTVSGALLLSVNNAIMDTIFATVISFPLEKSIMLREYRNGSYYLSSWFTSFMLIEFLVQLVNCVVLCGPIYFMVGLQLDPWKFFVFWGGIVACSWIGATCGLVFGIISKDVPDAQTKVMPTIVPLLLFCGYLIPFNQIPSYFIWAYYGSFFQWGIGLLQVNQWKGFEFPPCDPDQLAVCFETGDQYLATINYGPDQYVHQEWQFFWILGVYLVGVMLIAYFVLYWTVSRTKS